MSSILVLFYFQLFGIFEGIYLATNDIASIQAETVTTDPIQSGSIARLTTSLLL